MLKWTLMAKQQKKKEKRIGFNLLKRAFWNECNSWLLSLLCQSTLNFTHHIQTMVWRDIKLKKIHYLENIIMQTEASKDFELLWVVIFTTGRKAALVIFNQYHFFYWKQYLYQKLSFSIAVWSQEIVYRCSLNFERYRIIETCISIHRSYFCNNLSFCWE